MQGCFPRERSYLHTGSSKAHLEHGSLLSEVRRAELEACVCSLAIKEDTEHGEDITGRERGGVRSWTQGAFLWERCTS